MVLEEELRVEEVLAVEEAGEVVVVAMLRTF
jgi:hypothetical protein